MLLPAALLLASQVAALGLDPHKHLGKNLQHMQGLLLRLRDQWGCNPCGEGGEYESVSLDCPAFTCGRIVLKEWQVRRWQVRRWQVKRWP